jgi:hypothetical protein
MNTASHTESDQTRKLNPCFTSEPNLIALGATADDGRDYLFNYAQFLYAEHSANPESEDKPDEPTEQLNIHFAVGEVSILGNGLHRLAVEIQRGSLKTVKRISRNYLTALSPFVNSVTITTKENL